jgi:hypothetical protein
MKWDQVVIHREPIGEKFGNNPNVGVKMDIYHKKEHIHQDEVEFLTWYDDVQTPDRKCTRIRDNSTSEGYQSISL